MIQEPERWSRIQELFHQALEIADDERDNWLLQRCGRDTLLWREVASLLAADEAQAGPIDDAGATRRSGPRAHH